MKKWLAVWPLSLLIGCSVTPPKPYTPQNVDPTEPTHILVGGWLADWGGDDPDSNGNLHEIADDLKKRGLPYKYAPVRTKNNQSTNADIILETILSTPGPIIIVSGSRGTGEAALAIARLSPADKARIRAWISISGAHKGSGIAEYYASKLLYWPTAVWSAMVGWGSVENIAEMKFAPSRKRFAKVEPELRGIPTVSIVTVSRDCSHLTGFLKIGCNIVASMGQPHDGLILADDQVLPGSKVVRMEGHRHMGNKNSQAEFLHIAELMVATK